MRRRARGILMLLLATACGGRERSTDNRALFDAIGGAETSEVRRQLEEGADPNSRADGGLPGERPARPGSDGAPTPLVAALRISRWEVVELLLEHGADPHTPDDDGYAPIEIAIGLGDVGSTRALVAKGADVRGKSKHGFPLLFLAAGRGHADAITLLVKSGAAVDERDSSALAMEYFVGRNRTEDVAARLQGGGVPVLHAGATPLVLAAGLGHAEAVDALLAAGAAVDARDAGGRTALMAAAMSGVTGRLDERRVRVGRALLGRGADPAARTTDGRTPIDVARALSGLSPTHTVLAAVMDSAARRVP